MLELVKQIANTWVTWWMVGLLISFRMIVPARSFLSDRSANWLAHRLTTARGVSARRRFNLSFKRYVDRTFHARQLRWGRCRVWTLRYRNTAAVSMLTFLVIYCAVLLTLDFDLIYQGTDAMRLGFSNPESPFFDPNIAGFVDLIEGLDTNVLVVSMMIFNGLVLALFNTLTDYLSFLETRNVLARLGRGPLRDIFWVVLDVALTTLISIGGFVLFWVSTSYFGTLITGRDLAFSDIFYEGFVLGTTALMRAVAMIGDSRPALDLTDPAMIAMTFSTYATSVWIWVFFLSTFAIRSAVLFGPFLRLVSFLVDVEDYPFRAAWLMFAILWTLGIGIYAFL